MKKEIEPFFLAAADESDDLAFRAPVRTDTVIEPLIDGIETFVALSKAIAAASRTVHMAAWIFNPALHLPERVQIHGVRVDRWDDLLLEVARSGVDIKLLLTDFDPLLSTGNHQAAWAAHAQILVARSKLPADFRQHLQVMCSLHDATIGLYAKRVLEPTARKLVQHLNQQKAVATYRRTPGLWPLIGYRPKMSEPFAIREDAEWVIHPASHHQKVCVIDDRIALLGGIDVQISRVDDPRHRGYRDTSQLWHDLHCRVSGTLVKDIQRDFIGRWNREKAGYRQFIERVNRSGDTFRILGCEVTDVSNVMPGKEGVAQSDQPPAQSALGPPAPAQYHRTVSRNAAFDMVPEVVRVDIAEGYKAAIANAKRYIYIENQYVRSARLAAWIIERCREQPGLQVILVLPVAPEEVVGGTLDRVTNHGLHLQYDVLTRLEGALGDNVGFFSMIAPAPHRGSAPALLSYGSQQVYVHSKLLLIDDIYCNIGTANANPRSLQVDTEAAIAFYDPATVRALRLRLWREMLGSQEGMADWLPERYLIHWRRVADSNAASAPQKRSGFIVPHDKDRFPGQADREVPDEFAELYDSTGPQEATVVV